MARLPFIFGDRIENGWASERNPIRTGCFVRHGWHRGKINSGPYVVITDGRGTFWELSAGSDHRLKMVAKDSAKLGLQ